MAMFFFVMHRPRIYYSGGSLVFLAWPDQIKQGHSIPMVHSRGERTWHHVVGSINTLWWHSKVKNYGCKLNESNSWQVHRVFDWAEAIWLVKNWLLWLTSQSKLVSCQFNTRWVSSRVCMYIYIERIKVMVNIQSLIHSNISSQE